MLDNVLAPSNNINNIRNETYDDNGDSDAKKDNGNGNTDYDNNDNNDNGYQ